MRRNDIVNNIRSTIKAIAPSATTILYGSEARGDATPDSDIDLLILLDEHKITPEREMEIISPLYAIEIESGVIISSLIKSKHDWENQPIQTPFSINIRNEGITL